MTDSQRDKPRETCHMETPAGEHVQYDSVYSVRPPPHLNSNTIHGGKKPLPH